MNFPHKLQKILNFLSEHQRLLLLIVIAIAGIVIFLPQNGFQIALSQGDHGRDLYAAERSFHGDIPYRDYWWVYGPIMPYYYGLMMKWIGVNISGAVAGKLLLTFVSGLFIYLALSLAIAPAWAILATLWFWNFYEDFFFTYNHIGGVTALMVAFYCLLVYIKTLRKRYLLWGLLTIFIVSMVKINIGLFALAVFMFSVGMIDRALKIPVTREKKTFYLLGALALPVLILGVYAVLTQGMPLYEIRQCFPYLREDHPYNTPVLSALTVYVKAVWANIASNWINIAFAFVILLSGAQILIRSFRNQMDKEFRVRLWLVIGILGLFSVLLMHEFFASSVLYRTFWARPFHIILLFVILAAGTHDFSRSIRFILYASILWIAVTQLISRYEFTQNSKIPERYLALERGRVYLGNTFGWMQTVTEVTDYLKNTLKEDDLFFALPYDPLYYFLTGKRSPTRQLIFFDHINIPARQEKKVIADLERNGVNYVLISSRISSRETGLGHFGKTYCVLINKYLQDNFEEIAAFGDWVRPAGWRDYHGVKILKRINR